MNEVLTRRYTRILNEDGKMPDLIIVDGGKGQMTVAKEVVNALNINIGIAGLVKNGHHRTSGLLYGFPQAEVGVRPNSELFRLLEQMQDEVHRVAISFHKRKRSKRQTQSELNEIEGIGDKTASEMLLKFKSVKRISEAEIEELAEVIGKSKAEKVFRHFHKETV